MSLAVSWSLNYANGVQAQACGVPVRFRETENVRVRMTACCSHKFDMCIMQNADKTFVMTDVVDADFSLAQEITFRLRTAKGQPVELEKTLSGGDITIVGGNKFSFKITDTESALLTLRRYYAEIWITQLNDDKIGAVGWASVTLTDGDA